MRIATYEAGLSRAGPGLLLRDLRKADDPQVTAALAVIDAVDADILLLTGIDHDLQGLALSVLQDRLAALGAPYPYSFAIAPNTGVPTGVDVDANGRLGEPRDAQGYGWFRGEGGMAILSRWPIDFDGVQDLSQLLWRDIPGAIPPDWTPEVRDVLRLSTTGHWVVPVIGPGGHRLSLLAFHASPPVFDGPEDRNGRRNHDEILLWQKLLDGQLPFPAPDSPFVILGISNLDPADGEGRREAMAALLADPRLADPRPRASSARTDPGHAGDPALDTALVNGVGGLRLDVVLPSADLLVTGSGVLWPGPDDPLSSDLAAASAHRPVFVDLTLDPAP